MSVNIFYNVESLKNSVYFALPRGSGTFVHSLFDSIVYSSQCTASRSLFHCSYIKMIWEQIEECIVRAGCMNFNVWNEGHAFTILRNENSCNLFFLVDEFLSLISHLIYSKIQILY